MLLFYFIILRFEDTFPRQRITPIFFCRIFLNRKVTKFECEHYNICTIYIIHKLNLQNLLFIINIINTYF